MKTLTPELMPSQLLRYISGYVSTGGDERCGDMLTFYRSLARQLKNAGFKNVLGIPSARVPIGKRSFVQPQLTLTLTSSQVFGPDYGVFL